MTRPRMLDLFSGAGGSAVGYDRAGFDVLGVDIAPMPDYPYPFVQSDALAFLAEFGAGFDAIHSSPPCQWSSNLSSGTNAARRHQYVNLIPRTRELLQATGLPWVIENVQGAQVRRDLTLCGEMFGLDVIRHRYFELGNWTATPPVHKPHRGRVRGWRHGEYFDGPYFAVYGEGGGKGTVAEWQQAMGIFHTSDRKAIAESIPPRYAEFVGWQLIEQIQAKAA